MSIEHVAERLILADQGGYRNKEDKIAAISAWAEWRSPFDGARFSRHWTWVFPGCAVAMTGMQESLESLAARGFALGIITNGSARAQNAKIMALSLWRYCPAILISESCGLRKPDPAIFALALTQLGLPAEQVCFVGDNPELDIMAAERAGLAAIWRTGFHPWPENCPPPALQIQSLLDLPGIVGWP
jgi:putative hydrolase of the HAD superfamily